MSFQGKVVVITGASKGIGRATALMMAAEGAHVMALARSRGLLDTLVTEAGRAAGAIRACPADVSVRTDGERVVEQTIARYGQIDILINNAGVERVKPIDTVTDDDYAAMVDTNLKGMFLLTRAVTPLMKARREGMVINISSSAGLRGYMDDAVYCATKFGVIGFGDALDEELRPFGIRVCCIAPGATDTDLASDSWMPPDDPRRPYYLRPEDVARAIVFAAQQPSHVSIRQIALLPTIEPPYSPPLPLPE